MNKNKKVTYGIVGVVLILVAFYAGASYEKSKISVNNITGQFGQGQTRMGGARGTRGGMGGGFISGEIISQDANGITVKLSDGGSKIVFFSASTTIAKSTTGSKTDLATGTIVMINGKTNTDGSVTAQNIQIRPTSQTRGNGN